MAIPPKWDTLSTYLLQSHALDKLDWDIVSKGIIGEYSHLKGSTRAGPSVNKISAVKQKSDHAPSWKEKGKETATSGSDSGSQEKKCYKSCTRKQVKKCQEAAEQRDHAHMVEMAMVVDPLAPVASTLALLARPPIPTPLPIVTTVNGNSRIITAPAFILKALLAAIAAKPIPHWYTGTTEVWPRIWLNAKKACNLSDCMEMTLTVQTLKHLETHIIDVIEPPKDHSLKWQSPPCDDFFFTEEDFPFLLGSEDPSKCQQIGRASCRERVCLAV